MKGKTIIELTDKNGNKEVYQDTNMLTKGPEMFFANLGGLNTSNIFTIGNMSTDMITELYGGIMLLNENLNEDTDNILIPGGVEMVGNAVYNIISNDNVPEFGSYNASESGYMEDGSFKMTFDFSTNQANGTIKSLCLAPRNNAFIGIGNNSGEVKSSKMSNYDYSGSASTSIKLEPETNQSIVGRIIDLSLRKSTITVIDNYNINYQSAHDDEHFITTGKLKIRTYLIPISKVDVRCKAVELEAEEITLPPDFVTYARNNNLKTRTIQTINTDAFYITFWQNAYMFNTSQEIVVLKITRNDVVSWYRVQNTTGSNISGLTISDCTILNNKMLINSSTGSNLRIIDIANPVNVVIPEVKGSYSTRRYEAYTDNCIYMNGYRWDLVSNKILPTNSNNERQNTWGYMIVPENKTINITAYGSAPGLVRNTNFISSVNNLQTPVTKTVDKTMKVTYILTFDEEG